MLVHPDAATETLELTTDDGVVLSAHWHQRQGAAASVVVAHGFSASSVEPQVSALTAELVADGFHVLTYDARGHGASGGACSVGSQEHRDVAVAARYAAGRGTPVVLVGVSMGAIGVVRYLAGASLAGACGAMHGVVGAVLVSAPARWRMRPSAVGLLMALVTRTMPGRWAAARWLDVRIAPQWQAGEAPETILGQVRVPVTVIHGQRDRLLDQEHARRLHRAAPAGGRSRLLVVRDMGHGLDPAAREAVRRSILTLLADRAATPGIPLGGA